MKAIKLVMIRRRNFIKGNTHKIFSYGWMDGWRRNKNGKGGIKIGGKLKHIQKAKLSLCASLYSLKRNKEKNMKRIKEMEEK